MATTTNYGWTTPDDTDLVKDGAAAIRTLGSSVDTTTKALNPSTTLGDLEYRSSTANTNTRLAIGSTGDVLTVAGGVPTWAAPAGGSSPSYNLLNAGGTALTGAATITVSGISNQKAILVLIEGASSTSASQTLGVRFNGDTGLNYSCFGSGVITGSTYNKDNFGVKMQGYSGRSLVQLVYTGNNAAAQVSGSVHLFNADSTGWKAFSAIGATDTDGAAVNGESYTSQGFYEASAAITSVSVFVGGGTFDNGTVYVLGAS